MVHSNGVLRRVFTPFKAICIIEVNTFKQGQIILVEGVFHSDRYIIIYHILGKNYPYFYFNIIFKTKPP